VELGVLFERRKLCKELQFEAIFRGTGGDQLFFQNGSRFACPDYIFGHGIRPALLRVALNAAWMEGELMWELLARGMREARVPPLTLLLADVKVMDVLAPDAAERVRQARLYLHPWFRSQVQVPPGKLWQTFGLSSPYGMSNSFARAEDPDDVHPLMSQPLVELCLQIPTYVLASGGVDRALARQAFSAEAPAPILRRRIKGDTYPYPRALYARNREFVRELLLTGELARAGIVERPRLERILNDEPGSSDLAGPAVLLSLASAEFWLHSWTRQKWLAAA
jgi:asparagine synthase (glutamine-hydrolysing)